ncbi:hypothetical protein EKO04_007423 [Ascochyta lentis]|uniref:Histone H4 n=1 Tax=Ascochyta lentis TaxID=205686 RepID=A0A8H7J2Q0_9PLEO|nr:hypothetical protein EKO04_007423 [Ascochyta lentis]
MVQERPKQFGGAPRPGFARPPLSSQVASPSASRASQLGIGLGKGAAGLGGLGKGKGIKRHAKVQRDTIQGVTKGDIRRLARRGGVKRISATTYDDIRQALKSRLHNILREVIAVVEHTGRKTVCVSDIIFVLNRQGRPIYGFDPSFVGHRV